MSFPNESVKQNVDEKENRQKIRQVSLEYIKNVFQLLNQIVNENESTLITGPESIIFIFGRLLAFNKFEKHPDNVAMREQAEQQLRDAKKIALENLNRRTFLGRFFSIVGGQSVGATAGVIRDLIAMPKPIKGEYHPSLWVFVGAVLGGLLGDKFYDFIKSLPPPPSYEDEETVFLSDTTTLDPIGEIDRIISDFQTLRLLIERYNEQNPKNEINIQNLLKNVSNYLQNQESDNIFRLNLQFLQNI